MRSTFVFLASIYAGLATGFITPLRKRMIKQTTLADFIYNKIGNLNDLMEIDYSTDKAVTLESNRGNIFTNEEAMFELGEYKQNNVNERSFILFNQKYKKPFLNQGYVPRSHFDIKDRSLIEVEANKNYGAFSRSDYEASFKHHPDLITIKEKPLIASYFSPPYQYNLDDKGDVNKQFVDEPREYLELLKQPLLRTINSVNEYKERVITNPIGIKDTVDDYYLAPNTGSRRIVIKNNGFIRPYYSENIPILKGEDDVTQSKSIDGKLFNELKPKEVSRNSVETTIFYPTEIYTHPTKTVIVTTEKVNSCSKECKLKAENKISNKILNNTNCPCKRRKLNHLTDFRTQHLDLKMPSYLTEKTVVETSTPSFYEVTSTRPASIEFISDEDTTTEKPYQIRSEDVANSLEEVLRE